MAYYGRAQGYDGSLLNGTSENFTGENSRLKIDNNILIGTYAAGTKFITSSYTEGGLGKYDLQVKPGFLVYPGGTNEYWLANPDSSTDYKYYARVFQTDGAVKLSLNVNVGQTLVKWSDTDNDSVAAAVMFQSAATGINTGGGARVRPIIYDLATTSGTGNLLTNQANDDQLNPFSTSIDVGRNTNGGSISGNNYSVAMLNGANRVLNSTYDQYIILIRYKGNPTPIQNITVSYT